jgi:hypothetical protein
MSVRHSNRNLVDNICFFAVLIVLPCTLVFYQTVEMFMDTPEYQAAVAAIHEQGATAVTSVAQGPAATR